MAAVQTAPPSFESVWAALQETDRILKENQAEYKKEMVKNKAKSQKEIAKIRQRTAEIRQETVEILKEIAENRIKYDREMKEQKEDFYRRLGALTNLFGEVTEAMIAPKICDKFEELGFSFLRTIPNVRYNDRVNDISFEVDIMLENGDKAMLIEAKTKLTVERINYHLERMEKMHKYANAHGDKRTFLGAVAGIVVTDEVRKYALDQGLYFIEYAGENFYITPPNDKPKEW